MTNEEVLEFCKKFRKIFPNTKKDGIYPYRESAIILRDRFRILKEKFGFELSNKNKDIVLEATRKYVESFNGRPDTYMQTSQYFIVKRDKETHEYKSTLMTLVEAIEDGDESQFITSDWTSNLI